MNYQKIVPGVGVVENADIVKCYEVDKDQYVLLGTEEIDAIKLESKRTIDLVQFVDAKDTDYRYFEQPTFSYRAMRWPARATPSSATRCAKPARSASGASGLWRLHRLKMDS